MPENEDYQAWLADRRNVDPPERFTDRVMAQIERQGVAARPTPRGVADSTWFHVAACAAASLVFALRLGCAYSLFIPF